MRSSARSRIWRARKGEMISMEGHSDADCREAKWLGGRGLLLFHVLLENGLIAECTPQGIVVEKTFYGMRMYHKRGSDKYGSAMLFSFVFRKGKQGIVIVSPHLIFLCFMYALPLLAIAVCVGVLFARGLVDFAVFGIPTLIMASLWQLFFQKFLFNNVYRGQKQYDQTCRQFIAALRKPCSLSIVSMRRVGLLSVFVVLWWRYLVAVLSGKVFRRDGESFHD